MSHGPGAVQPYPEFALPSAEELASANEVMLAMVKAAKALRIYLPNNPVLIRFIEELNARMAAHMGRYGEFRLDVETFVLRYKGGEVYANTDPKDSIAFRIHADGIRILSFSPGLEQRELNVFLGVVAFEQPTHQDDDIVTQLWERDLPHISYVLEEDLAELSQEEERPENGSQQEAISRMLAAFPQIPAAHPLPRHLLTVTREDTGWLRQARQAEVQRNPTDDVFRILFAILEQAGEPETFQDFLQIVSTLINNVFVRGDVAKGLTLVRLLDRLRSQDTRLQQRGAVERALNDVLCESTLNVLQEAIDSEAIGYDEVRELLLILGLPSLPAICELLGRAEKLKMRKLIVEVLVELGRDRPEVFAPYLADPRWYLVRNVVLVLSLLGTPKALEMIVALISHKEQRIRREVLGFLERSPDPKAKPYIVKYLRDESVALRIKALQILAREKPTFALKPVLALISSEDFKSRDLNEKKAVYEALGELGGEQMLPLFREMLLKKRWFKKAAQRESAVLAVAGLVRIGSRQALELLEEARRLRDPETREAIEQGLAGMASGLERETPAQEED